MQVINKFNYLYGQVFEQILLKFYVCVNQEHAHRLLSYLI